MEIREEKETSVYIYTYFSLNVVKRRNGSDGIGWEMIGQFQYRRKLL